MKLLQKTNRAFIILSAALVLLSGIILYFALTTIVRQETTEKLLINIERVARQIEHREIVTPIHPVIDVKQLSGNVIKESILIKDTIIYDPVEEEDETFLEISSIRKINGQSYKITLRRIIVEPHDYYNSIGISLLLALLFILLVFYYINKTISQNIWKPFYHNLETIKHFSLVDKELIDLKSSGIKEFAELNIAILKLINKARSDYKSLKEFSENASHEIQTPLAVIKAKLETLLNTNNLTEEQLKIINAVNKNINRLSKLNKDLLLITKIENHQFNKIEKINFTEIVQGNISKFAELIEIAGLDLDTDLAEVFEIQMDKNLAHIIVENLISNALKYTPVKGKLKIETMRTKIVFSNTGDSELEFKDQIFQRFYKNTKSTNSSGLGLAIVKSICELNNITVRYMFKNRNHQFILEF